MIVIFGLRFLLIDWLSFEEGCRGWGSFEIDVQGQGGGRCLDLDGQRGRGS